MLWSCPGCGSNVINGPVDLKATWRYGKLVPYSSCPECGLLFQSPMPEAAPLANWYKSGGYRGAIGGTQPKPIVIQRQNERAAAAMNFMAPRVKWQIDGFVELGGGLGSLCALVGLVYKTPVVNVEVDEQYADVSRKNGIATVDAIPDGPFSLAASLHTLEHLANPRETLERMYQVLVPGGHLYLEVPRNEPDVVHTLMFSQDSVRVAVEHAGFKVLECEEARPIEDLGTVLICWATKEAT
jgi:SAM-dependent methyltransferase